MAYRMNSESLNLELKKILGILHPSIRRSYMSQVICYISKKKKQFFLYLSSNTSSTIPVFYYFSTCLLIYPILRHPSVWEISYHVYFQELWRQMLPTWFFVQSKQKVRTQYLKPCSVATRCYLFTKSSLDPTNTTVNYKLALAKGICPEPCAGAAVDLRHALKGVQGARVTHSMLQGNWQNRSFDGWIFSETDFMIPIFASSLYLEKH